LQNHSHRQSACAGRAMNASQDAAINERRIIDGSIDPARTHGNAGPLAVCY
jgi:hypothetical protein